MFIIFFVKHFESHLCTENISKHCVHLHCVHCGLNCSVLNCGAHESSCLCLVMECVNTLKETSAEPSVPGVVYPIGSEKLSNAIMCAERLLFSLPAFQWWCTAEMMLLTTDDLSLPKAGCAIQVLSGKYSRSNVECMYGSV